MRARHVGHPADHHLRVLVFLLRRLAWGAVVVGATALVAFTGLRALRPELFAGVGLVEGVRYDLDRLLSWEFHPPGFTRGRTMGEIMGDGWLTDLYFMAGTLVLGVGGGFAAAVWCANRRGGHWRDGGPLNGDGAAAGGDRVAADAVRDRRRHAGGLPAHRAGEGAVAAPGGPPPPGSRGLPAGGVVRERLRPADRHEHGPDRSRLQRAGRLSPLREGDRGARPARARPGLPVAAGLRHLRRDLHRRGDDHRRLRGRPAGPKIRTGDKLPS